MENKESKDYNLYEDKERQLLELLDKVLKVCRRYVPTGPKGWWLTFKYYLGELKNNWRFEYSLALFFVILVVYLFFMNIVVKPKVVPLRQVTQPINPLAEPTALLSPFGKPVVTAVNFYRDGDILVCDVNLRTTPRDYNVSAVFIDNQGHEVATHSQPVTFNEERRIRFVLPYDPNIQKVKIYVKE